MPINSSIIGIVIGIDVGGSTTKITGINKGQIQLPMFIAATDPVTPLFGAFDKYIYDNETQLSDVGQVILTDIGSTFVDSPLYRLPIRKTDKFTADRLGAHHATDVDQLITVSMRTGTSFVEASGGETRRISGMGIGGGMLQGLSRPLLETHDICRVADLAAKDDITRVDLQIDGICNNALSDLPVSAATSLFRKMDGNTSQEDIACSIIYTVLQIIGGAAMLSALNSPVRDFMLIGNLTQSSQYREVSPKTESIYHVRFHIPSYAEYHTTIGAALAYVRENS